jgi:UDP-N-acetylmuramoyl-tripeptide--D-alanyl-D-alanine ligase
VNLQQRTASYLLEHLNHHAPVVEIGEPPRRSPAGCHRSPQRRVVTNVGRPTSSSSRGEIAAERGLLGARRRRGPCRTPTTNGGCRWQRTRARILRFGQYAEAEVHAERSTSLGERGFAFDLVFGKDRVPVHVAGLGESTVWNALAASAAALAANAPLSSAADGLARYQPMGGRMERVSLPRNIILIDDTYNANPQSMEVALAACDPRGERIAALAT